MTLVARIRRWFKQPYHDPVRIPARAQFLPDVELEARIDRARAALPPNSIPRLIEPQPDEFLRFPHVPEDVM